MNAGLFVLAPVGAAAAVLAGWAALARREGRRRALALYRPPRAESVRTPGDRGLPWEETPVTTRGGNRLAAWWIPGRGPHTVVVCHPVGRDRASVLPHIRLLHEAGHHVLAYDLRNHGASDDDPHIREMAARFTEDLHDVLGHVRSRAPGPGGRVGVLALSFSTWPAVYGLRDSPAVDAVVCDSGPGADLTGAMRRYFDLQSRLLPKWLHNRPAVTLARHAFVTGARRRLGVRPDWLAALADSPVPMLFVAAGRDTLMPPDDIAAVARHAPRAQVWTAPHSIHVNAHRLDRAAYTERLTAFYEEAFGRAAVAARRADD
ncbi:alpha/beta hydrolase [Streptomyces sp. NBC_00059]|uniref:alpha/beta hydrolase n=1 Tax=Streptomyces sp. NBC_00059 TaxID=2975635 RepID=UPI002253020E|nr:alpha/beta hydrolase [Streptomyces sp. NBC_00059]MCX5415787.1 lysophospholipase [Streptomyces sp. NBC_00059]